MKKPRCPFHIKGAGLFFVLFGNVTQLVTVGWQKHLPQPYRAAPSKGGERLKSNCFLLVSPLWRGAASGSEAGGGALNSSTA